MKIRYTAGWLVILAALALTSNAAEIPTPDAVSSAMSVLPAEWQKYLGALLMLIGVFRVAGKLIIGALHKYFAATGRKTDDEFLARIESSAALSTFFFWVDLLLSVKPYRGPATPAQSNPNAPVTETTPSPAPSTQSLELAVSASAAAALTMAALLGLFALVGMALTGCAHLDPGADPLIVRAEQTEAIADSTFSLFLHLEDQNHALIEKNAPEVTAFAEWLRAPLPVHGTNMPRASALIFSLNDVKAAYRANRSSSNLLEIATATLAESVAQASNWTKTINAK